MEKTLKECQIRNGPGLSVEICGSSILESDDGKPSSPSDQQQILKERQIKNGPGLSAEIICSSALENVADGIPSSPSDQEQMQPSNKPTVQSNDISDINSNSPVPKNEIELSFCSLSQLYQQINGLHNPEIDLDQESCINFCLSIAQIKSNHRQLLSYIANGKLIKFEQLVVWGRNLNRNTDDLIKEAKPSGSCLEEAQEFVLKMMRTEIRYRQRMTDNNQTYIYSDTDHYKFSCIACDRRDNNLTWLVAHLCRDTAEIIYMCSFCGFLFFNNACALIYHVILDLMEESKNEYCIECERFFPSVSNHLMDTEGSWKVCCDTCDFISLSQCSLLIHQRFHKMEKYHACPECGAYFVFFHSLEEHLKNVCYFNYKKLRHICPICAIIFKDRDILHKHLSGFHHQRWIQCIYCPTLLSNRNEYRAHRAQNHPELPCTYQICHTCTLCPGLKFKSIPAQFHMKNHAYDTKNYISLYVCDCNYFTIHKHNFIKHKNQNCVASPSFGKWDNNHELKVCSTCNDVKFINLSKPFVCENCELLNNPESKINSLTQGYECKVCKLFLNYNWEAVIEHFFIYHPDISVCKYSCSVKSIYISGSKNAGISRSGDQTTQHSSSDKTQSGSEIIRFCGLPKNVYKINKTFINNVSSNGSKAQPISRKKITKAKNKVASFYGGLSHFMVPNSTSVSSLAKEQFQKNNAVLNINAIQSPPLNGNDMRITRLGQPASILDRTVSAGDSHFRKHASQDNLSVTTYENTTMLCASSFEVEKNELLSPSNVNILSNQKINLLNQSGDESSHNTQGETLETSDKAVRKDIHSKKKVNPNHSNKTNNIEESNSTNFSSEDFIKTEAEITTKKSSLECKKCRFKCNERIELVKHFSDVHFIQNTYQCMECGECFANLKNKINHLKSSHKIDTKHYLEPDFDRLDTCRSKFRCPVCLKGFLCDAEKNLHMRCHGMAYLQSIRSSTKET